MVYDRIYAARCLQGNTTRRERLHIQKDFKTKIKSYK